ncbi:hypothetical protein QWY15_11100 [Planococcus sp. N064]|uniref:Uncharacterized protein n=1 Tax=Planococcus liqunii TaxID=3058394 RepID=A0ABT8MSW9_9BACL|nr:hypothetical protein [Planococcus sp. N064]MDN7227845.1 hypothetical protein [Planococcus sp. N064]
MNVNNKTARGLVIKALTTRCISVLFFYLDHEKPITGEVIRTAG